MCDAGWSGRACDAFHCSNDAGVVSVTLPPAGPGGGPGAEVEVAAAVGGDYAAASGCAWQISAGDGRGVVQARVTLLEVHARVGGGAR
jgi:hypothetical protein